jgi:hypothetical protein
MNNNPPFKTPLHKELSKYLVGMEKKNRDNTLLVDSAKENSKGRYLAHIKKGYNPFRIVDGKYSWEYAHSPQEFYELTTEWVSQLAFENNVDLL